MDCHGRLRDTEKQFSPALKGQVENLVGAVARFKNLGQHFQVIHALANGGSKLMDINDAGEKLSGALAAGTCTSV
jgi:hypothetical protein